MISKVQFQKELELIIANAVREDIGEGDHSSLACIPEEAKGKAKLLVKDDGIIAGVQFAQMVFNYIDKDLKTEVFINDGDFVRYGDVAFTVEGKSQSILKAERLVLNAIQRMSAIATKTNKYVKILEDTNTQILDTRKTTPGIRALEKWSVLIGGGTNHRFALYDMVMLKDNHIDFAGGIEQAIVKTNKYLKANKLDLKIEIETRNLEEVDEVLRVGNIDRIMLDNFSYEDLTEAVKRINHKYETEASGGITEQTLRKYADCGVDFISSGALTHSVSNMDFSLKAVSQ
jgi:nicotinate-nucleotide pyrophosphorylase (carboxylating)